MEHKQEVCPWCGGTEMAKGTQREDAKVYSYQRRPLEHGHELIHIICRSCGTVVRSYVDYPEDLK